MKRKKNENTIWDRLRREPEGFLTPEGYLENLEDKLLSGMRDRETKTEEQPVVLDRLSVVYQGKDKVNEISEHGFRVPAGYFDGLEKRLIEGVASERSKRTWLDRNKIFTLSIAASLLLLIGIRFYDPNGTTEDLHALSTSEIDTWIDNGLVTFNSYDIAETFDDLELYPDLGSEQEVLDYLGEVDVENLMTEN
jgi:hypothetical protein